jgi:hypothetical protein
MANFAIPIEPVQDVGGAVSFEVRRQIEEAGQTAPYGTPVQISATDGGLMAWAGSVVVASIAGILQEGCGFSNLGTTGVGAPQGFTPVLGIGGVVGNYAANANQPLAVITPALTPINDGRAGYYVASPTTVFTAKVGNTASAIATTQQMAGTAANLFGLTKDTNNYWFVDTAKTGASACVQVVGLDPRDPVGTVGGRVLFVFMTAATGILS